MNTLLVSKGVLPKRRSNCGDLITVMVLLSLLAWHLGVFAASMPSVVPLPLSQADLSSSPARIAAGQAGTLYITDPGAGAVLTLDAAGRTIETHGAMSAPLGIAADRVGRVYVGDGRTGAVNIYDAQSWTQLGALGAGSGEFKLPGHILAVEREGITTVYVSDGFAHAIKTYRDNNLVGYSGAYGMGPNQFDFPAGICSGADGNLYVVDQNNDRVQVLSPSGDFLRFFSLQFEPGQFGNSGRGQGIAADSAGRLYIADAFQGRIAVFDLSGAYLGTIGQYGTASGRLRLPGGLLVDGNSRLLVANTGNAKIEAYGLDCYFQPVITPASQVIASGGTVSMSVDAPCAGASVWQWYKDAAPLGDNPAITGATASILTISPASVSDTGRYSARVSTAEREIILPEVSLTVIGAPAITLSPAGKSVPVGTTVALSVGATGSDLHYRWYFNGLQMNAPDTNTLLLANAQIHMTGRYWAVVTNIAGSATSAQASLAVMTLPSIVSQPGNLVVAERTSATFQVTAESSAPLSYQWYRESSPILNATNKILLLSNATPSLNGGYSVRIWNSAAFTNSRTASLTVLPDTVPPSALVAAGGPPTARTILVTFSEPVSPVSARQVSNYQLWGPGNLSVLSAVMTNQSQVLLTLSANRTAGGDYILKIQDVIDTGATPNRLSPNPSLLSVVTTDSIGTVAWWPFNEGSGLLARDATGSGFDATLESASWLAGPFGSGSAVNLDGTAGDVLLPALNLYTNTVTITAWIKRSGTQPSSAGIVFTRAGNSVAGIRFGTTNDLRYVWNDNTAFPSRLVPPDNVWTLIAVVVEPARAVVYMNSGSGLLSATNTATHALEEFNGMTYLGWDNYSITRRFRGAIDDVRICNRALTAAQIQALYNAVSKPAACTFVSPVAGSTVAGPNVKLTAAVTANGNAINKVEFLGESSVIGVAHAAPYSCVWSNLSPGSYVVKARTWFGPGSDSVEGQPVRFSVVIPIILSMEPSGEGLRLSWTGGTPPYQVQSRSELSNSQWENVGPATNGTSIEFLPERTSAFYRVIGN